MKRFLSLAILLVLGTQAIGASRDLRIVKVGPEGKIAASVQAGVGLTGLVAASWGVLKACQTGRAKLEARRARIEEDARFEAERIGRLSDELEGVSMDDLPLQTPLAEWDNQSKMVLDLRIAKKAGLEEEEE